MNVRILNGALDEHEGRIILRGSLDPAAMDALLVDDYQREVRPASSLGRIMSGYELGSAVPDVELGMRGQKKQLRDSVYTLLDPVYIIDGLQRISAAKMFLSSGKVPYLGAAVHFGTNKEWERKQFKILNADRTRVSGNVIFRNLREDYDAVASLYSMNEDSNFVLRGRLCWEQSRGRSHLITGLTLGKVACMLHSHLTGFRGASASGPELAEKVQKMQELLGKNMLRANIRTLFDLVDEGWGVKRIAFQGKAPHIKSTFLLTLARMLSNHEVFWRENRLLIEADLRRKFAQFPVYDPTVCQLAAGGAGVDPVLYKLFVDHLNRGKRNRKLLERQPLEVETDEEGILETVASQE